MFSKFEQQFKDKMNEGVIPPGVVLADVSGSMSGLPMDVCIAISILLSDLFEGPFKNKVLTFETNPGGIQFKEIHYLKNIILLRKHHGVVLLISI